MLFLTCVHHQAVEPWNSDSRVPLRMRDGNSMCMYLYLRAARTFVSQYTNFP